MVLCETSDVGDGTGSAGVGTTTPRALSDAQPDRSDSSNMQAAAQIIALLFMVLLYHRFFPLTIAVRKNGREDVALACAKRAPERLLRRTLYCVAVLFYFAVI